MGACLFAFSQVFLRANYEFKNFFLHMFIRVLGPILQAMLNVDVDSAQNIFFDIISYG